MNEYRIIYGYGGESPETTTVIERGEGAARVKFKSRNKGVTIHDIELIAENVPATKDQEREALEKIKQMVDDLGPGSYIGTAFEGCFQDAETNIENDFAFSMKARVEDAEEKLREMGSKLVSTKADATHLKEQLDAALEERSTLERKLAGQSLPAWLDGELRAFVGEAGVMTRETMASAAEIMAVMADTPRDIAFTNAVNVYRKAKAWSERCERLLSGLNELTPKE